MNIISQGCEFDCQSVAKTSFGIKISDHIIKIMTYDSYNSCTFVRMNIRIINIDFVDTRWWLLELSI